MSPEAILNVDIIDSTGIASMLGGHSRIKSLREEMLSYLDKQFTKLNFDGAVRVTPLPHQGDDIAMTLSSTTVSTLGNVMLAAAISAFNNGPAGDHFRYVGFCIEPDTQYLPRIGAFGKISKTPKGKEYHFALDQALASALSDQDIINWICDVPGCDGVIDTPGEPSPSRLLKFFCKVNEVIEYPPLSFLRDSTIRQQFIAPAKQERTTYSFKDHAISSTPFTKQFLPQSSNLHVRDLAEIGEIQLARGKLIEARKSFENALATYEETGNVEGRAHMETNLGRVAQAQKNAEEAQSRYDTALELAQQAESPHGEAIVWRNIGSLHEYQSPERAITALMKALSIEERLGKSLSLLFVANAIGRLLRRMGDLQGASKAFAQAASTGDYIGQLWLASRNYGDLGSVLRDAGQLDEAKSAYEQSLAISKAKGFRSGLAITHDNLGRVEAILGNDTAAEEHFLESLAIDEKSCDIFGQAKSHANLGVLFWLRAFELRDPEEQYFKRTAACDSWKSADALFIRALNAGGTIRSQTIDFRAQLGNIRQKINKAVRKKGNWNELFF